VREGRREVLHRRQPHALLGRVARELGGGRRAVRQGLDRVLPRLPGPRPGRDAPADRGVPEGLRRAADARGVRGGPRRRGHLPVDLPARVVQERIQHHRAERGALPQVPRQVPRELALRPARRRRRHAGVREERRGVPASRGEALHRGVERRVPRLQAHRPRVLPLPGARPGAGHPQHPRAQGPDDLAAGQGRLRRLRRRPRRHRLPGPELHRRARGTAAHRGLLLHGDAGAQRVRRAVGGHRRPHARPPAVPREGDGRAAVLGRRGQDALRLGLQHLDAEVAGRGPRGLGLPRGPRLRRLPAPRHRREEEDPRAERGEALRHRGPGRVPDLRGELGPGLARRRGARRRPGGVPGM
ncbi:MAG: Predicted amidohydrolase SSO1643, partial [uncultured Actinomycetospora sp.]